MADLSFVYVPAAGFTAFSAELVSGVWGTVTISTYLGADGRAAKPLGDAPALIAMKLQLSWSIMRLVQTIESAGNAKDCDELWDGAQKRLNAAIGVGLVSKNSNEKAAAGRLEKKLLLAGGEGQTKLKYQQEVDFGRKQIHLTSEGQGATDVALLGLGSIMTDIASTTDALAETIGHGVTGYTPSRRKRAATAACIKAFGAVADGLDWIAEFGTAGFDREQAIALRAPMVELAARYPAPSLATKVNAEPMKNVA